MNDEPEPPSVWIGVRHRQIGIMFFGLVVCYQQRVNLSVALVAMTDADESPGVPTVNYTIKQKGILSGMFFYGYMVSNVPAGFLADKYGPTRFISIVGGIFCGVVTTLMPIVAIHTNFYATCVLRIVEGLGQGFFYPCINSHIAKWAIPAERGKFSYVWNGAQFGAIVMLAAGGQLAGSAGGWPCIFYYSGSIGVIWGIFCLLFGKDSPSVHPMISVEEKHFIESNIKAAKRIHIPWTSIFTSIPFLALMMTHFCAFWGFFTFLTLMPTFLKSVYGLSAEQVGLYSALPYLFSVVIGLIVAASADIVAKQKSSNFSRKLWNTLGLYGSAISLAILSAFPFGATGAISLLTIAISLNASVHCGYMCNHIDLSPNLAGVLLGITNAFAMIGCIAAPTLAGFIVKDEKIGSQWSLVWLLAAGVYVLGNTIFLIFGTTQVQSWNEPKKCDAC